MPHQLTATQNALGKCDALRAIVGFHLVTPDLLRLVAFYQEVLGFALEGPAQPISEAEMALLAIAGGATRQVLSIGLQRVAIEQFDVAGQLYPPRSDAASLWFQHIALVVVDITAAYARISETSRFPGMDRSSFRPPRAASEPSSSAIPTGIRSSCWNSQPANCLPLGNAARRCRGRSRSASTIRR